MNFPRLALSLPWFAALLALTGARAADPFTLAPHLTDNMVVQQNADTLFYGLASPREKVRIKVPGGHSPFTPARADAKGQWSKKVSFGSASFNPLEIEFYLGDSKEPARTLRNILSGEVWIAGINFSEGIRATNPAPALRFFTLSSFEPGPNTAGTWRIADAESLATERFDLLAFEFAVKVASAKSIPIGVIQLPGSRFAESLRSDPGSGPSEWREVFQSTLEGAQLKVDAAIRRRSAEIQLDKRLGKVADHPEIFEYTPYRLYDPGSLSTDSAVASRLEFKGAIGPR